MDGNTFDAPAAFDIVNYYVSVAAACCTSVNGINNEYVPVNQFGKGAVNIFNLNFK